MHLDVLRMGWTGTGIGAPARASREDAGAATAKTTLVAMVMRAANMVNKKGSCDALRMDVEDSK
jgi:hypothetical protein